MNRSARLQKKLLSRHIFTVAEDVVANDELVALLWGLEQGERFSITSESLESDPLARYGLQYTITRGPMPGHWLHRAFDQNELELLFTANEYEHIGHGWLLFNEP